MQGTNKIADEAKRIGEEAHEQAKKVGREYETSAQAGFDAASRSFSDANRGFQMIAAEMTEYSKKTLEDGAWEQLVRARSYSDVVDIQTRYAQRAYESHAEEMSKLTDLYLNLTPRNQANKSGRILVRWRVPSSNARRDSLFALQT